jgi:hypothetical protein
MPQGYRDSILPVLAATADLAVVRLHGQSAKWESKDIRERFGYRYTEAELEEWAPKVRAPWPATPRMGEVEVAAVPGAVCDGLGLPGAGRSTRARPGRLNFFSTERPWVPPSRTRETLPPEYLVTMTTHVPAGTPERALPDVRAREAARASETRPAGVPPAAVAFAAAPGQERAKEPAGQATGR